MNINNIKNIISQYYPAKNIASIKNLENKIVIEIANIAENNEISENIKKKIHIEFPDYKISIFYVENKSVNIGIQEIEKWQIKNVKHIIGVASGKGGVGKSTTSVNLALAIANCGKNVALVDADIYGPSIPTMLGYEGQPLSSLDGINFEPFKEYGLESISIGSLIDRNTPLIWRGSKACGAIEQLTTQTNWSNIDVMVIDMPPGTGDIQITLSQRVNFDGIVIVSTPQDIALIDAIKGVNMFRKTGTKILGIIENMSYFICPHCQTRSDIFGHEGAKQTAESLGETFLGEIPLHMEIRENSDKGTPIVALNPESPHTKSYEEIAQRILSILGI